VGQGWNFCSNQTIEPVDIDHSFISYQVHNGADLTFSGLRKWMAALMHISTVTAILNEHLDIYIGTLNV